MRLFLAADIDGKTRQQLAAAQDALRSVLERTPVPPRVAWVSPTIAHVTLRFLGETTEDMAARLHAALAGFTFQSFQVTWGRIGTFGGRRNPKTIWLGPTSGLDQFTHLAQAIDRCIDPVIGAGRVQPFAPHLTLGRIRERGRGVDWTRALEGVRLTPTSTQIIEVTLYQSRLSSRGPTYTALSSHG
jgi:2'-5' RNA ligase